MKKGIVIFLILLSVVSVIFFFIVFFSSWFKIKNIKISKDFNMNNEKIVNYLGLYPSQHIWKYKKKKIEQKLDKLYYLTEYKVTIKFPDTIILKLIIRKPVARILGIKGDIYVVDKYGVVFRDALNSDSKLPILIYKNQDKIKKGLVLKGTYKEAIDILDILKKENEKVYLNLAQIEIKKNKEYGADYKIFYKTLSTTIYLKKNLNTDSIVNGLITALYLDNKLSINAELQGTVNGFLFMD